MTLEDSATGGDLIDLGRPGRASRKERQAGSTGRHRPREAERDEMLAHGLPRHIVPTQ